MASEMSSDHRERRDNRTDRGREGERAKSPAMSSSNGSLYRQPSRNMSNIESSVTRLLVATKQLIDTLTKWSKRQASETDVSDVYVRLGNEFNVARTCFERAGIEMSDLAEIPNQLRTVLETCLARDASPRILEIYLPQVREIVINLLQGLKRKQARYRTRTTEPPTTVTEEGEPYVVVNTKSPKPTSSEFTPERKQSPARRPVGGRSPRDTSLPRTTDPRNTPVITTQEASPTTAPATSTRTSQIDDEPSSNDALAKLQTSDALQRRASKRYSAYNFAKLDEGPPPVPARRSGSYSPETGRRSSRIRGMSPRRRSPERRPIESPVMEESEGSRPGSTVPTGVDKDGKGKIPVFLQLGNSVRKTKVSPGELTMQSLRLLFVEKFQYNPGAETFPDILISDRESGVRYILESMEDIVEGTSLTLDVEGTLYLNPAYTVDSPLQKTFSEGMSTLLKEISTLQHTISSQQTLLTQLTEQHTSLKEELISHRTETLRKIDSISTPKSTPPTTPTTLRPNLTHLKSLKSDLNTLKSDHQSFMKNLTSSLTAIRQLPFKDQMKLITDDTLATQKSDLEAKTQALVTLSDDLSDQVDDLRIDITQKRIRPHPRTLTSVKKHAEKVRIQLTAVESQLTTVKPLWKRTWQDELQRVIDGQEFLRHQETLVADLKKDLTDTEEVIVHVVQAAELLEARALTPREWLSGAVGSGGRDAVLGEVKSVQPNSAERIEAIERAEKARQRELELRRVNEFQEELGELVNEEKLKEQSEGALRVEREREEKERKLREQLWLERQQKVNGESHPAKDLPSVQEPKVEHIVPGSEETSKEDKSVKRAVSEGSSAFASAALYDDGVARSQSHSSALSRMKRISGSTKRFSGGSLGNRGSIMETEENENPDVGETHKKIGVLEKDVV